VQEIEVVGPLPDELQSSDLTLVASSPMLSENPAGAMQLIDFLGGPKAAEVYRAKGLQPE